MLVLWALAVIAILLHGILLQIWKKGFLFTYGMAAVCVCYLALSFSHVDYFIARYNLAHMDGENSDYSYLMGCPTTCAGHLRFARQMRGSNEMLQEELDAYLVTLEESTEDSIRQFNVFRYCTRETSVRAGDGVILPGGHMAFSNQTEGKTACVTPLFLQRFAIGSREPFGGRRQQPDLDTIYGKAGWGEPDLIFP